jgi:uncharacterized membrane protein YfcA
MGALAGLIGLGGGEFRLPVLVAILGFTPRAAVPMNLVVTLVTLAASLVTRAGTLSLAPVVPHLPGVAGLATGDVLGAAWSSRLLTRLSDNGLESALALLLAMIGLLLVVEAFLPSVGGSGLLPNDAVWRSVSGLLLGIAIGAVAALLGVAGGELLIPTLMFVFGSTFTSPAPRRSSSPCSWSVLGSGATCALECSPTGAASQPSLSPWVAAP